MKAFIYLCILLFIIIFSLYLIWLSFQKCPIKIQKFYLITLTIMLIRYLSLLSLWIVQYQKIIYIIKTLTQLTFVGMPLLSLTCFYIYLRDENRKFDYNYIFMVIIFLVYIFINIFYKMDIKLDSIFGFIVSYKNSLIPSLIYLIIMSCMVVATLFLLDKPYNNSSGMVFLLISLIITISEFIIFLGGIKIFPYPVLGEISMLLCSYKAILTFKK